MLNSYPLSLSSNESILGYLAMIGFYQLPITYLADYPKQIASVSSNDIQQALHKYIQPEKMLTVVVGQPFDSNALNTPIAPSTPASQPSDTKPIVNPEPANLETAQPEQIILNAVQPETTPVPDTSKPLIMPISTNPAVPVNQTTSPVQTP